MVTILKEVEIPGVEVIPCRLNGPRGIVKSFLVHDEKSTVLVDSGFNAADGDIIAERLKKLGRTVSDLSMCIVTHYHGDHTGGLKRLRELGSFPLVCHEVEVANVEKDGGVKVDRTVKDGEVLPECGSLRVLHTPGHSGGHIALYHEPSKSLICGDSIFSAGEWLVPSLPNLSDDPEQARESVKKVLAMGLEIEHVLVAHGEDVYTGAPAQLGVMFVPRRGA
jgi:glyoxylase-like metal-dependent hydrolase (beta-lactamase superfamily II)